MTDLQWNQYVETVAREIVVPQSPVIYATGISKRNASRPKSNKMREPEVEVPVLFSKEVPKVSYIERVYFYKGKEYTRTVLDKYSLRTYTKSLYESDIEQVKFYEARGYEKLGR